MPIKCAFDDCSSLQYNEYDNAYYLGSETNEYLCLVKAKSTDITSCTINENCKFICSNAFLYCTSLTSVTIGSNVTSIGDYAFDGCFYLTEINYNAIECADFSSGSTGITSRSGMSGIIDAISHGNHVFDSAGVAGTGITVTIGKKVKRIPAYLFFPNYSYLPKITEVIFEKGSICEKIRGFYCKSIEKINYNGDINDWVQIDGVGNLMSTGKSSKKLYINGKLLTEANITTATKISGYAFYDYDWLTSITIGNSVTSIEDNAFQFCSSLKSVTIGNNVTSIEDNAFQFCSSLKSVTIGNNVTSMGEYAFGSCNSLTSVTIKNGVTSIGSKAFTYCKSLMSIEIPNSVTSIGWGAFWNCSSLTSITFSDTSTWYRTDSQSTWENKSGGTYTSVTNSSTNATNFKSTYYNYYWYKI